MSAGRVLVVGGVVVIGGAALARFGLSPQYETLYASVGLQHGVAPEKLHALALQESRENPNAVNHNRDGSTDYGIMQINSANLTRFGLDPVSALIPALSVDAAAQLLAANKALAPGLLPWDEFSVYNAGFKFDPATGLHTPRTNAAGVYVDLAYVLNTTAWWFAVWAAKLSLFKRT